MRPLEPLSRPSWAGREPAIRTLTNYMRLYALVEAGDPEAIDVYLREEDAQRALEDCLRDEPSGAGGSR